MPPIVRMDGQRSAQRVFDLAVAITVDKTRLFAFKLSVSGVYGCMETMGELDDHAVQLVYPLHCKRAVRKRIVLGTANDPRTASIFDSGENGAYISLEVSYALFDS